MEFKRKPFQLQTEAFFLAFLVCLQQTNCWQNPYQRKPCGMLYSQDNFGGANYPMIDEDQSLNLAEAHRTTFGGWNTTASIRIAGGCRMQLCNETYFDGSCRTLTQGAYTTGQLATSVGFQANSVDCICSKVNFLY